VTIIKKSYLFSMGSETNCPVRTKFQLSLESKYRESRITPSVVCCKASNVGADNPHVHSLRKESSNLSKKLQTPIKNPVSNHRHTKSAHRICFFALHLFVAFSHSLYSTNWRIFSRILQWKRIQTFPNTQW